MSHILPLSSCNGPITVKYHSNYSEMYQAADSSSSLCMYKSSSSSKGKERANERNQVFLNFYLILGQNFRTMIGLWSNKKFEETDSY